MMQLNIFALAATVLFSNPQNAGSGGGGGGGGGGGTAPVLVATDIVSGSLVNGENGKGSYVRIIGANMGTLGNLGTTAGLQCWFRDSAGDNIWYEAGAYRTLVANRVTPSGLQEACVQIGSLGGAQVAGRALDMKITLAGVDSNIFGSYFTNQPGNFWFISTSGADGTGVINDIGHPYRFLQVWTGSTFTGICASGKLAPGDTIVLRGGAWGDQNGYDSRWFRFATTGSWATGVGGGSAPTGATGHGWIHFTAYPGEDVHFTGTSGGGIHGCESSFASSSDGGHGQYVSVSGIHFETTAAGARDASGVNGQNGARHWRVVSNEMGPWATATGTTNAGGVTGVFQEAFILYNDIHDISGNLTDQQNHGIYFGGGTGGAYDDASKNLKISANWMRNCVCGSGIQGYWQNTNNTATSVMTGIEISGNFIDTTLKYGINLGQSTYSAKVFNNQIVNCGLSPLRLEGLNTGGAPNFNIQMCFNTCYGWNTVGSIRDSVFVTEGYANNGVIQIEHNIFAGASGRSTSNSWYANTAFGGADSNITMSQNVYYDYAGTLTGSATKDASPITATPNFTNRGTKDFTLTAVSSAIDAVTTTDSLALALDILLATRPKGVRKDCGCFESA